MQKSKAPILTQPNPSIQPLAPSFNTQTHTQTHTVPLSPSIKQCLSHPHSVRSASSAHPFSIPIPVPILAPYLRLHALPSLHSRAHLHMPLPTPFPPPLPLPSLPTTSLTSARRTYTTSLRCLSRTCQTRSDVIWRLLSRIYRLRNLPTRRMWLQHFYVNMGRDCMQRS